MTQPVVMGSGVIARTCTVCINKTLRNLVFRFGKYQLKSDCIRTRSFILYFVITIFFNY